MSITDDLARIVNQTFVLGEMPRIEDVNAVLARYSASKSAQSDVVLVPREPTEAMCHAATMLVPTWDDHVSRAKYKAMLAAAPQASEPARGEVTDEVLNVAERAYDAVADTWVGEEYMGQTSGLKAALAAAFPALIADRDRLAAELAEAKRDAERLDFFVSEAERGACPALLNDDNGHWAVSYEGTQNAPMQEGPQDIWTSFVVPESDWLGSPRDAIDAAIDAAKRGALRVGT